MFGKKNNNWYRKAYKLYFKGKLEAPYDTLFSYYYNIEKGFGHYDFFRYYDGKTGKSVSNLQALLSEDMFENFLKALEAYNSLGEDADGEKVLSSFEKHDEFFIMNDEEIVDLLQKFIEENY